MTIEQEFFETFGVEPKKYYDYTKAEIEDVCENCFISHQCISQDCCNNENLEREIDNIAETFIYPPITPEIVLGLEEIILELCKIKTINSNRFYYYISKIKSFSGTYGVAIQCKENDEIIGGYHSWGNNSTEALLKLCIEIQPEIQEEVRGLFNGK